MQNTLTQGNYDEFCWDEDYEYGPDLTQDKSAGQTQEFRMLTGIDYPELCQVCRTAIDDCYEMIGEMPDDWYGDDNELPYNMAYDLRMFCGKHECINKPINAG